MADAADGRAENEACPEDVDVWLLWAGFALFAVGVALRVAARSGEGHVAVEVEGGIADVDEDGRCAIKLLSTSTSPPVDAP